jgi:hypothetical protein
VTALFCTDVNFYWPIGQPGSQPAHVMSTRLLGGALIGGASRAASASSSLLTHARSHSQTSSHRVFTALTPELAEAASVCVADSFAQQTEPFTWLFNLKRHHWFSLVIPFIERASHGANGYIWNAL